MSAPARTQPPSLTVREQRARSTRPDLWPSFTQAVFPEQVHADPDDDEDMDLDGLLDRLSSES